MGFSQAEADPFMITRRMREMAVRFSAEDMGVLKLPAHAAKRLSRVIHEARRLDESCPDGGETLRRLARDGGIIEAFAKQAAQDSAREMSADGHGVLRIRCIVDALCKSGRIEVDEGRLLLAVSSFDEVQALTMREIWAVPQALRICAAEGLLHLAEAIVADARQMHEAERWLDGFAIQFSKQGPPFFEHALRLAAEREMPDKRCRLEKHLSDHGETPENMVRQAHGHQADLLMRMENLMACRRLADAMDWEKCFKMLSQADSELHHDPAGVYPEMEEASQTAVRREVEKIAGYLKLSELTIARNAVDAAAEALKDGNALKSNICYWLMTDEGRGELLERMGERAVRLPRIIPDPGGKKSAALIIGLAAGLQALWMLWIKNPWLWAAGVPIVWKLANSMIGAFYPRFFSPARLLKLKIRHVPDEWRTLVVMPVLLSSPERARELCVHLEGLGCLEKDPNIRYLILGDFSDSETEHQPDDDRITETVRREIERMNQRAGRAKYGYLHRPRTWMQKDRRWMGFDRKRGALMALNRLLMGQPGAEEAFSVENRAGEWLRRGFEFVVTLDADTEFLPGTVQQLIGCMAHPLNRRDEKGHGFAVLQPRMEMMPSACVNEFVKLYGGSGGVDVYPVSVSSFWQDLTGEGIFAGKGIYDVKAFSEALEGALPEGRILSHDLIEGSLAGAGFVGDIAFYDGYPSGFSAWLKRLNRWTRGDWQLLPILLSGISGPGGKRVTGAARLRMADNLIRSLFSPALFMVILASVWTGSSEALLAALLAAYFQPIISMFRHDKLKWRRATAELAMLPAVAFSMADAVLRTIWRIAFSGKHLLDWVTAADAENKGGRMPLPGRIAALLLIPGLLVRGWIPTVIALMALFTVGAGWVRDMEEMRREEEGLSGKQIGILTRLARETWHFFETYVPADGCGLPPDNVQMDPPAGVARRTSPTNIGLYLVSCLAAAHMGFIRREEMLLRMQKTMNTMAQMEKWRGHLYNWYDIDDLQPLPPRYVSSVDSGNLAACLLLCAAGAEDELLANRMRMAAENMDFKCLYDDKRDLFAIGMDAERQSLSASHYDLLASESRILSYTSIMLGQIPIEHWQKLGRACVSANGSGALLSWSGTAFEYLMPELFMPASANALLGESCRGIIRAQRAQAHGKKRPWGISESGYYAFDERLNYQYRAFGLDRFAMSGCSMEDVVAPYASVLAVNIDSSAAAENIELMRRLGWTDAYGLYEAADYMHCRAEGEAAVVKSHMAHHQGMILCALCNALADDYLSRRFMDIPEARALRLLLQEKPMEGMRIKKEKPTPTEVKTADKSFSRNIRFEKTLVDGQILSGGTATAIVTADGAVHYIAEGIDATRFGGDFLNRKDGACLHFHDQHIGEKGIFGGTECKTTGEAGIMSFKRNIGAVEAEMKICVSPEDGTLIRAVELCNHGGETADILFTEAVPIAFAKAADMRAHPVFKNLFIESERLAPNAVCFRRRQRDKNEARLMLVHMACAPGHIDCETDYEKLIGRMGSVQRVDGIAEELTNTIGAVLNPVSALRTRILVPPGERRRFHFAMGIMEEVPEKWLERYSSDMEAERVFRMAGAQVRTSLGFIGIKPVQYHLLQRMSFLLLDGRLAAAAKTLGRPSAGVPRSKLWEFGISGDMPILLMELNPGRMENIHAIIRAHEFYHLMGIQTDLIFIDHHGGEYERPARDMLLTRIAAGHLRDRIGKPGGVWLLDTGRISETGISVIRRSASLVFDGDKDFYGQARNMAVSLEKTKGRSCSFINPGENRLSPNMLHMENGYGGFAENGSYAIDVLPERATPAPWCNILSNDHGGILLTERSGSFIWHENSRSGRLTAFENDPLYEGWGLMLYLYDPKECRIMRLLPGDRPQMPFRARFSGALAEYGFDTEMLSGKVSFCMKTDSPEVRIRTEVESHGLDEGKYCLVGFANWLMGTDAADTPWIHSWNEGGACFASGTAEGVGYFATGDRNVLPGPGRSAFLGRGTIMAPEGFDAPASGEGWAMYIPFLLGNGEKSTFDFAIGWASGTEEARKKARMLYGDKEDEFAGAEQKFLNEKDAMKVCTPDPAINYLANGFLIHQIKASRVCGRTGFYQPGGAYGFRDQLQDMLAILHFEPERVRRHLLRCAAHQFEDGDVMHWWHEPYLGVRTRISDDMLFLPWVTAAYVRHTGDTEVLNVPVPYLENVEIPYAREDVFQEMRPGAEIGTLHDHCMRAFRRVSFGSHGLALMGAGDWNDGMNRVGHEGRGESIWLSEFLAACAAEYVLVSPEPEDGLWLNELNGQMKAAIEAHGWDGNWYLRAYDDSGKKLGSREGNVCRIDAISQAWAVLAGLDEERCHRAMDSAWRWLVDEQIGVVRLLTPAFDGKDMDSGYISGYPEGVRENGAQYTHGVCWLLLAMIEMGDSERAHRMLRMLLPVNHSLTSEQAEIYKVEPYVMAADVYSEPPHAGRGGWTWYTGAAAWMYGCILAMLGYERVGNRVRLNPLLGEWPEARLEIQYGSSRYCLISNRDIHGVTLDGEPVSEDFIEMRDDGRKHEACFPQRDESKKYKSQQ